MPDHRAYICEHPRDDERGNLYHFCRLPENAWAFSSLEGAQTKIEQWKACGMSVEMDDGAILRNPDFKIEEWNGEVLVYFDGPKRSAMRDWWYLIRHYGQIWKLRQKS